MLKTHKITKATQSVIPVKEYDLKAALLSEGHKPTNILKDSKGNIWLLFKSCHDVKTTIQQYHLGTLRVPMSYESWIFDLSKPPYWIE